jgi:hypothetical protein
MFGLNCFIFIFKNLPYLRPIVMHNKNIQASKRKNGDDVNSSSHFESEVNTSVCATNGERQMFITKLRWRRPLK